MVRSPNEWLWNVKKGRPSAPTSAGRPFESTIGHFWLIKRERGKCGNLA